MNLQCLRSVRRVLRKFCFVFPDTLDTVKGWATFVRLEILKITFPLIRVYILSWMTRKPWLLISFLSILRIGSVTNECMCMIFFFDFESRRVQHHGPHLCLRAALCWVLLATFCRPVQINPQGELDSPAILDLCGWQTLNSSWVYNIAFILITPQTFLGMVPHFLTIPFICRWKANAYFKNINKYEVA